MAKIGFSNLQQPQMDIYLCHKSSQPDRSYGLQEGKCHLCTPKLFRSKSIVSILATPLHTLKWHALDPDVGLSPSSNCFQSFSPTRLFYLSIPPASSLAFCVNPLFIPSYTKSKTLKLLATATTAAVCLTSGLSLVAAKCSGQEEGVCVCFCALRSCVCSAQLQSLVTFPLRKAN